MSKEHKKLASDLVDQIEKEAPDNRGSVVIILGDDGASCGAMLADNQKPAMLQVLLKMAEKVAREEMGEK